MQSAMCICQAIRSLLGFADCCWSQGKGWQIAVQRATDVQRRSAVKIARTATDLSPVWEHQQTASRYCLCAMIVVEKLYGGTLINVELFTGKK